MCLSQRFYKLGHDCKWERSSPIWLGDRLAIITYHTIMNKEQKQEVIQKYKRSEGDVGSVEVQVAIMTARILELTEHLKINKKDFSTRRGLVALVNRRRKLLRYLASNDYARYTALIGSLGLRR